MLLWDSTVLTISNCLYFYYTQPAEYNLFKLTHMCVAKV